MGFRDAPGTLARTHNDFHRVFPLSPVGMRNDNTRMRFRPPSRLAGVNLEGLHSSKGGRFLLACFASRLSTASHSGSSGRCLTSGSNITMRFLDGLANLTKTVSSSISCTVTAALGLNSGGITKRRRSSNTVAVMMGYSHRLSFCQFPPRLPERRSPQRSRRRLVIYHLVVAKSLFCHAFVNFILFLRRRFCQLSRIFFRAFEEKL